MKRYDSYKDSGVESLGVVPESWNTSRFKYHHIENDETVGEDSSNFPLLSLTKRGVILRDVESGKGKFPESFDNYKIIEHNDLIFCLYDIEETPRTVGISENYGMITGSYKIFKTKDTVLPKFTYFTYLVIDDVKGLKPYYTGLRNVIRPETFKNLPFNFPPLPEQQQIVSFLDTKTSLIDSLIEKTQRKIELLKEKRTSLINEVVTKGLNPNVEMKDSGVEWIGEIPSHYQIGKLKHLCNENQRSLSNSTDPKYELNYIEISDVNSEGVIGNSTPYIFSESPSRCRRIVQKGDVIVSTVRTYLKSIGLIEEEVEDLICSTGFSVLTPDTEINSKYLFYLLRTEWFISMVISNSEGVSYPSIQSEKLMNIDVVFCEFSEQQEIVSYLDEQTQLIDKTITIEEKRIELLKEYRQSLISEVVTGKLKVTTDE